MGAWRQWFRDSRFSVLVDLSLVAAIFFADAHHLIYFSKTPYLLTLGWVSMAVRGISWRDAGLRIDDGLLRAILMGIAAGAVMEALELFVTQPVLVRITGKYPDLSDFLDLVGNLKLLLILIAFSWVVAGFGEELAWRGYLLNRVANLTGRSRIGWVATVVISSVVFGLAHSYQHLTGIVENTIAGILLGCLYLATGRRLIVPIVAHAITDTIDVLIIFSGHYPGM